MTYGPEVAGRCSPTSLGLTFLPPLGWQALAHWHKRSLTPLLAAGLLHVCFLALSLSKLK